MKKTKLMVILCLMLAIALVASACQKQTSTEAAKFPAKNITIVVPANAGGGGDIQARKIAESAGMHTNVAILVENHSGGGGATAMSYNWQQAHDGYNVMLATNSTIICNPYSYDMPHKVSEYKGVIRTQADATVLFVKADNGVNNLQDFINLAKSKRLKIGGYSVGSVDHISAFMLGKEAGYEFDYVPYDSGADSILAVVGGHIDAAFTQYSDLVSNAQGGIVTVLGTAADDRYGTIPDVPTFKEAGYGVPNMENWRGYVVPNDVPDDAVQSLHDLIKQGMEEQGYKEYTTNSHLNEAYLGPKEFTDLFQAQYTEMGELLNTLGLK